MMIGMVGLKIKRRSQYFSLIGVIIATLGFGLFQILSTHQAEANSMGWVSSTDPGISWRDTTTTSWEVSTGCHEENNVITSSGKLSWLCITNGSLLRLATNGSNTYASFNNDSIFYPANNTGSSLSPLGTVLIPGTNKAVVRESIDWLAGRLAIYNDFSSRFHRAPMSQQYAWNRDNPDYVLKDENNDPIRIRAAGYSENGRWVAAEALNAGIVLVNTDTHEAKLVSKYKGNYGVGQDPSMEFRVSNDGRHLAMAGGNTQFRVIDINDNCGATPTSTVLIAPTMPNPCPERELYSLTYQQVPDSTGGIGYPRFSADGGELSVHVNTNNNQNRTRIATLVAPGYTTPQRLDYLALGDSISSGEGDTELNPATSKKYYRAFTDVEENSSLGIPREKCHLSTRSYPYYMARWMGLGTGADKWRDVACSGAQAMDTYNSDYSFLYNGQAKGGSLVAFDTAKPRLEGYAMKNDLQVAALNEFIPGRIEQVKFVKKHKPKVITLTMGANNIDFAGKLKSCVLSLGMCDWATSKKSSLAGQVQGQYDELLSLYKELYDASGNQAKIYVLGYPRFVSDAESAQCGANTGFLNHTERQMIVEATNYFNIVIERAANAAGVKYIDVSDALEGGRLCDDGQEYVTGVAVKGDSELSESFHPNDFGHIKMTQQIRSKLNNQNMLAYNICDGGNTAVNCPKTGTEAEKPAIPSYFGSTSTTSKNVRVTSDSTFKDTALDLALGKYMLRPGSTVQAELRSDPINLGAFVVDNDGSMSETVNIPSSVSAGYHTLILTGETYSSEPIELTQTLLVRGVDAGDVDENGVLDSQQSCGPFLTSVNIDTDLDGTDDACDPKIGESQLYRVRQGDPGRSYNDQPEKEHYLYIERNMRAAAMTGITGDNDPDNDGWAIVGASQGIQFTGSTPPDTGPAANFEVVGSGSDMKPYVYIRAGGWGCVGYAPTNLAAVQPGQSRTLKKIAINTNKCRPDAQEDDVDADSMADNSQPIYTARQGDSAKGEDPSRIYIYRNFYAAETQLGLSDYSPTGTAANTIAALPLIPTIGDSPNHPVLGRSLEPIQPWNLLAASKSGEYIPQLNKLVVLQDAGGKPLPTILTKKQNGQCIAYQPENTEIIKFSTKDMRRLVKMTNIPQGENCD